MKLAVSVLLHVSLLASAQAADSGIDAGRQRGTLVAGVSYPLPAYVAGAKFRTPESPESTLVEDLGKRLKVKLGMSKTDNSNAAQWIRSGRADVVLALVDDNDPLRRDAGVVLIPTGYSAGAMAIMRSDTDIKSWEQLKGRTVCLSEGGAYVGKIAAKYGAIEKVQRAPADSLLSLRIGACDAAVHDDTMLNDLLKLPEWKKFSARLPVQSRRTLVFAVRADDAKSISYLRQTSADWAAGGFWPELKKKWVNHVAFEVYLDQNVPDCH
ncbi:transporter substrate-binding domain-containing protein [Herbaspirillum sp. RV1423]|uniref:transporter substrate-binding domain-containing protein n=1 Tax=Herbaspirillum sp. RV1423 TaxID=1443993 RepID=UPI0004B31803|nr:transporter substrate-binding domain-containing protein [Herbaspirillum sp. RV1423]